MFKDITLNFICDVCGLPTGDTLVINTRYWDEETGVNIITGEHWSKNYVDHRHKACEQTHGVFKEMVEEYHKNVNQNWEEAEEFVKTYRKREDFDVALENRIQEIETARNEGITGIEN
jgi:hypothetical protein